MRFIKSILATSALSLVAAAAPVAHAQINISIGAEPSCPYGYYGYSPYRCAPYGYYGPEWFSGGRFVGAGRWYHGGPGFYGHVNHSYDPRYGYHGGYPEHGPAQAPHAAFKANESRDGQGHADKPHR